MATLAPAFLLGLLGSLHCLGMCGPIVLALPFGNGLKGLLRLALYNGGRLMAYISLGLIFFLLGRGLSAFVYQQYLSLIAGGILLLWAFSSLGWIQRQPFMRWLQYPARWVQRGMGFFIKRKGTFTQIPLGMLNGFLPCGLSYVAAVASVAQLSLSDNISFMLFFGLGTWPAMLGLPLMKGFISPSLRLRLSKAVPYLVLILGLAFMLRGLGLGIPYLSPTVSVGGEIAGCE